MISDRELIINEIKHLIVNDYAIDLCILFGSAAQDRLKKSSDIDIVIGSKKGITNEQRLELSMDLSKICGRTVSVLDIAMLNGIVLKEVLVKGITIKNVDAVFKAKHITRMLDFMEDLYPMQKKGLIRKAKRFAYGE